MSERPGRYQRTTGGLVAAMLVTVVVVVAAVAFLGLFRNDLETTPETVDYRESVELAEDAGFPVVHPDRLPEGWRATSVDLRATGDEPSWAMGVLTADGSFVGLRQADESRESLVATYVDEEAEQGDPVRVSEGALAGEWQTWTDSAGDLGLVRRLDLGDDVGGDGGETTVLVYGSASEQDLLAFTGSLTR